MINPLWMSVAVAALIAGNAPGSAFAKPISLQSQEREGADMSHSMVHVRKQEYEAFFARQPSRLSMTREIKALKLRATGAALRQINNAGPEPLELRYLPDRGAVIVKHRTRQVAFDPKSVPLPGQWTIDWFQPSPDGKLLAVSASPDGTERGTLFLVNLESGKFVDTPIPNVHNATAGGDLVWLKSGREFLYTRYPLQGDEKTTASNQRVYRHVIGREFNDDIAEIGKSLPALAEIRLIGQANSDRVIGWVQDGDSGRFAVYFRRKPGQWDQLAGFNDGVFQPLFGPDDQVFLVSNKDSPNGRIIGVSWNSSNLFNAKEVLPERADAALAHSFYSRGLNTATLWGDRLLLVYQQGGPMSARMVDLNGAQFSDTDFAYPTAITGTGSTGDRLIIRTEEFGRAESWFDISQSIRRPKPFDPDILPERWDDIEIIRLNARSKDGTPIPFTLMRKTGLTGIAPVLVGAYGGFGISRVPSHRPELRALLDRGVTYVDANIRGGSEFGYQWRTSAMGKNRQRAYDDFQSVLETIHRRGLSTPALTAIEGSSNGGLLMGVTLTQRPDLARTVLADVGLYDMLQFENSVNGAFNVAEYGSINSADERAAMLAYSPLHNVKTSVDYPAVLFSVGENDARVDPGHSHRFYAALKAADTDNDPVIIKTRPNVGHYLSGDDATAAQTDAYVFLLSRFAETGWKARP